MKLSTDDIRQRMLTRFINEAAYCLQDGIIENPVDANNSVNKTQEHLFQNPSQDKALSKLKRKLNSKPETRNVKLKA